MKKLTITKCNQCDKFTLHVESSAYSYTLNKEMFTHICLHHPVTPNVQEVPVLGVEVLSKKEGDVIYSNDETLSSTVISDYAKQDLFYILMTYYTLQNKEFLIQSVKGGRVGWEFDLKLPAKDKICAIKISNYLGSVAMVGIDRVLLNDVDIEELNNSLNIFMNYIIHACDESDPGFIKAMLLTTALDPSTQTRLDEARKYFLNTSYGSFMGGASTQIVAAANTYTPVYKLLPKTTGTINGGSTWTKKK